MIAWLQRQKLIKKGLACGKQRRQMSEETWIDYCEHSTGFKIAILAMFTVLLYMCSFWGVRLDSYETPLLTFIVFFSGVMLMRLDLPEIWNSNSRIILTQGAIWLNLFIAKAIFFWSFGQEYISQSEAFFLIPASFAPLTLGVMLGARAGLYAAVQVSLLNALSINQSFSLLLISLITGFTAIYFTRRVRRRGDLVKAGMAIGIASLICALAFGLVGGSQYPSLLRQAAIGIAVGIGTAILVNAFLPILEYFFNIITDISWVELADLNHPLLRQMTIEAPGTYHHSLVVANLLEAAALSIGLNGTKCRVMAYFHDIGKMIKPEYFTENIPASENPHDNLSPSMSALIIIAHVKEGVDLALKSRLKKPVLDAIQQHHGDTLVYYFYKRAKQMESDAKAGGKIMNMREDDIPEVAESSFRYPGPRPQTKEIALLMLADAIEGASRSLEKPTPQRIESLVQEIIEQKIQDHQLDECDLTMKELHLVGESFTFTVKSMLHSRIRYPKDEKTSAPASAQSAKKNPPSSGAATAAA